MDNKTGISLKLDWTPTEIIKVNDICVYEPWEQDFMCFKIIPYEQFEYLYFGSFDYKDTLFAVQTELDGVNYVKVLTKKSQQEFAFHLYKKWDEEK